MNLLLDESVDAPVAQRLRTDGHAVTCVWELEPGIADNEVLARANRGKAVLVTADKDFGELVFRLGRVHNGVLLIRFAGPGRKRKPISCRRRCASTKRKCSGHSLSLPTALFACAGK